MKLLMKSNTLLFFCFIFFAVVLSTVSVKAQINQWIRFSNVQSYFTDYGTETENDAGTYGGGLVWPAAYGLKFCSVRAKGLWIGCQNFTDPVSKLHYNYKVLTNGPRTQPYDGINVITQPFKYIGKYNHPVVTVDGKVANTTMGLYDVIDEMDPTMQADRMLVNTVNHPNGITMTRKIMVFPNQYNNNFFVYDYVFKNTGIIDAAGTVVPSTLDSCIFAFQYRYTLAGEAIASSNSPVVGWAGGSGVRWGQNSLIQVMGTDPTSADFKYRAHYGYYGPFSQDTRTSDDWGCPNPFQSGSVLAAARYIGCVTLHADKSAHDQSDDKTQPMNTSYLDTDDPLTNTPCPPYDITSMAKWYQFMRFGKPATGLHPKSHADQFVASTATYADLFNATFLGSSGGPGVTQGFGPYTLAPGDSIHIVLAEGVTGLDRDTNRVVSNNWYAGFTSSGVTPTYTMPSGVSISGSSLVSANPVYTKYKTGTADYDLYKDAWVFSIEDSTKPYSIQRMFQRAVDLYNNGFNALQPPPAPEQFIVTSGATGIQLTWTAIEARASAHFNGFVIYRAAGSVFNDVTVYQKIFECDKSNSNDSYLDTTAARATGYFYYIQSKSDGLDNTIEPGVPLLSSQFLTQTEEGAYLLKPGKPNSDSIYIVPNPYIVRSRKLQWGLTLDPTHHNQGFDQDRIAFVNLPAEPCTIRIFTERGELIWQTEHTNGSAGEQWNQKTTYGQTIVSGIYIAHFQTQSGKSVYRKFVVIR